MVFFFLLSFTCLENTGRVTTPTGRSEYLLAPACYEISKPLEAMKKMDELETYPVNIHAVGFILARYRKCSNLLLGCCKLKSRNYYVAHSARKISVESFNLIGGDKTAVDVKCSGGIPLIELHDRRLPSLNKLGTIIDLFPRILVVFREKLVACAQNYIASYSGSSRLSSHHPAFIIHSESDIAVKCFKDYFTPYGFVFGDTLNDRIHKKCKAIMNNKNHNVVLNMDFFELFM